MSVDFSNFPLLQEYWKQSRIEHLQKILLTYVRGNIGLWRCQTCGSVRLKGVLGFHKIGSKRRAECEIKKRATDFILELIFDDKMFNQMKLWRKQLSGNKLPSPRKVKPF